MELNLVVRMRCANNAQRKFILRLLRDNIDRPIFEEDVAPHEREWFRVLDEIDSPSSIRTAKPEVLYLMWMGSDDEQLLENVRRLGHLQPADLHAVIVGDEGWYRLWVRTNGHLNEYETWHDKDVIEIFEGSRNVERVLDKLAQQSNVF